MFTMGKNNYGQLGDGTKVNRNTLTLIKYDDVLLEKQFIYISGAYIHSIIIDSNGNVYGMGGNNVGQLGDGTNTNRLAPVASYSEGELKGKKIIQSSCWDLFTILLDENGSIFMMDSFVGQTNNKPVSQKLDDVKGIIRQIATYNFHLILLDNLGYVYAIGKNTNG